MFTCMTSEQLLELLNMVFQKGNNFGSAGKGKIPWNKGDHNFRGNHWTKMENAEEIKEKIRLKNIGKKRSANPVEDEMKIKSPYRYNILVKRILCPEGKCQDCNTKLEWSKLQLHHEDVFNRQPETVDIKKLRVLCPSCHKKADVKLWKEYKLSEKVA